jgi:hypothetical protein
METKLEVELNSRRGDLNLTDTVKDLSYLGLVDPFDRKSIRKSIINIKED